MAGRVFSRCQEQALLQLYNTSEDKAVSITKGRRAYERNFTIAKDAPPGEYKLDTSVWRGIVGDQVVAYAEAKGCHEAALVYPTRLATGRRQQFCMMLKTNNLIEDGFGADPELLSFSMHCRPKDPFCIRNEVTQRSALSSAEIPTSPLPRSRFLARNNLRIALAILNPRTRCGAGPRIIRDHPHRLRLA